MSFLARLKEEQVFDSSERPQSLVYLEHRHRTQSSGSEEFNRRTSKAQEKLKEIMKPLNFFTKIGKDNSTDEKMEITADDFELIVNKLRELNVFTHEGAKEVVIQEKLKRRGTTENYRGNGKLEKMKGSRFLSFQENFLTQAARSAASSPPLIRIDEWNASSRKLHKHSVFPVDTGYMSIMNERCQTRLSALSDVLNNSVLSLQTEFDNDESLFEEPTPENNSYLEHSKRRSFLLTVRQESEGNLQSKQLIITIEDEDEDKTDDNNENDKRSSVSYKDNNISLRSICSMEIPSGRSSHKYRRVSVTEIEFLS